MNNIFKTFFAVTIFFVVAPFVFGATQAAFFKFENSSASSSNGGTFQVGVVVDPGSDSINSVDIYVMYDSTLMSAKSVTAGTLFPTVSNDTSTAGKIYVAGMVNDPASSISASGTVATITFQALKEGSGNLTFDCNSSKIIKNDINASNVITCSSNGTLAVTIGNGGSSSSSTPTPTSASSTPSQLPQTGIFDNVLKFSLPGIILLVFGGIVRLLL